MLSNTTLLLLAILGAEVGSDTLSASDGDGTSLKEASKGKFAIGAGISDAIDQHPADWELLNKHFEYITPENCMKPASVQPTEGAFRFEQPDRFMNYANENHLKVVGHCLVWAKDDRTPEWFYLDEGKTASREKLLERMRTHIREEVGRYRGKIAMWDVVNEALDDGDGLLRDSGWSRACGDEFIFEAFRVTHEVDPNATLIYNDYNNEFVKKREKMVRLVRSMLDKKVPIHAVGLQGHYELDKIPLEDIEATIVEVKNLGLKLVVSELDIDVVTRGKWWAENGKYRDELAKFDPYHDACPPEILERQAAQYRSLMEVFVRHSDSILRLSFWNLHDGESWLNYFPWRRVNYPLLFDRERQPKPAYEAVLKALGS